MSRRINFHLQLLWLAATLGVALTSLEQAIAWPSEARKQQQESAQPQPQLQQALTPEQWTRKYWCDLAAPNSSWVQTSRERKALVDGRAWPQRFWYSIMHDCNRDPTIWRARYIDELLSDYRVLVRDSSADQRLAHILYSISVHSLMDNSYFLFNSGDPRLDRENMLRIAGPSVDDAECELDLHEMTQQLDELGELLEQRRSRANSTQPLEERHIKMVRALDTFGRYESGTLSGNVRLPGSYALCLKAVVERRRAGRAGPKDMQMRYCWARTSLRARLSPLIRARERQPHESADDALPVGVCLPRSCHSKNLNSEQNKRLVKRLLDSQLNLPASMYLDQHVELESLFCLPDADAADFKMPTSGKLWIACAASWVLICCAATYLKIGEQAGQPAEQTSAVARLKGIQLDAMLDMKQPVAAASEQRQPAAPSWRNIAKCFNLNLSWKEFSSDRVEPDPSAPVDLDVLNPIKVGACLFCVLSHATVMLATQSRELLHTSAQVERDSLLQAALALSTVIDTFFVISGFLFTFIASKRIARMLERSRRPPAGLEQANYAGSHKSSISSSSSNRSNSSPDSSVFSSNANKRSGWLRDLSQFLAAWLMFAANRYLRLVPLYAFIFYFRRDVFKYLGSGPFWDYGFNRNTMTGHCDQSSSLEPFTFDSLKVSLNKQCIVTAWTISLDILFGLLIPPFLLLLHRRPKPTLRLLAALALGCSLYGIKVLVDQPAMDRFELLEIRVHGVMMMISGLSGIYTSPIIRAASFLAGVIAGFALFRYSKQEGPRHWPHWLTGWATKLSVGYLIAHVIVSTLHKDFAALFSPYHRLYGAYMMTLDRAVWSAANAVLFLRMTTDWRHGFFTSKFAHQNWRSLARLNFAIIFVHWLVILAQISLVSSAPAYSQWNLFACLITVYIICTPIALLLHVVFENPMDKLIKSQIFKL